MKIIRTHAQFLFAGSFGQFAVILLQESHEQRHHAVGHLEHIIQVTFLQSNPLQVL